MFACVAAVARDPTAVVAGGADMLGDVSVRTVYMRRFVKEFLFVLKLTVSTTMLSCDLFSAELKVRVG